MKTSRFKYEYRKSASKQHKLVGEILRTSEFFSQYQSFQEYPVSLVNTNYPHSREHYDWIVKELKLVIEVMGEQHFKPVQFGGITLEEAEEQFHCTKIRDRAKKRAAIEAGWTYITINYSDKDIMADDLINAYMKNFNPNRIVIQPTDYQKKRKEFILSDKYKEQREKFNKRKREQYRKLKAAKKESDDNNR